MKPSKGWAINFREWINIRPSSFYLKEILWFDLLLLSVSAFFYGNNMSFFIFVLALSVILMRALSRKRELELDLLESLMRKIRKKEISRSDEINLGGNLDRLEKEIRLMFQANRTDLQNLRKSEKARTEFLGNVSHELRNPIFAIQGFLETLLDGALSDQRVNRLFLEKARQHTEHLSNLLNDLIDISMIESGRMKMSFRYFNINDLLLEIIQQERPLAEGKGLRILLRQEDDSLSLFGDRNKLRQVMVNLVSNAIKYTEKGYVEISVISSGKYGKISVRDTGVGIPEEDTERIFERFYRVDKARSREVGGTGLGLAIVKHILEAHKTKIEVKSLRAVGSEFSFKLKK